MFTLYCHILQPENNVKVTVSSVSFTYACAASTLEALNPKKISLIANVDSKLIFPDVVSFVYKFNRFPEVT